jgi:hypothetical protein
MSDHAILVQNQVAAMDVGIYNRSAVSNTLDFDNGNIFRLDTCSSATGESEVWAISASGSETSRHGLWMAASPEVPITTDDTLEYRGLNQDPRRFYNIHTKVFDAFKPQIGDIITLSADAFGDTTPLAYANSGSTSYLLHWNAALLGSGSNLGFRRLATTYLSVGTGAIDNQRVTAYKLVCEGN